MIFFDSLSERSRIKDISTTQKVLFFIINIIIIFMFNNAMLSFLCVISLVLLNKFLINNNNISILKLLLIPCVFLITGILPIIFEINNSQSLLSFNFYKINLGISQQSIQYASLTLFKALAIVLCSYFLILNTQMTNLFNFMQTIKMPTLLINMFELTYRFIYIILNQTYKIRNAQQARLGYVGFKNSLVSFSLLFKNVFIKSFESIAQLRIALDSRLYDEEIYYYINKEFFSNKFLTFSLIYWILLIIIGWRL